MCGIVIKRMHAPLIFSLKSDFYGIYVGVLLVEIKEFE